MSDRCPHCSFQPENDNDFCAKHDPRRPSPATELSALERRLLCAEQDALRAIGLQNKGGQHAGSPRLRDMEQIRLEMRQLAKRLREEA